MRNSRIMGCRRYLHSKAEVLVYADINDSRKARLLRVFQKGVKMGEERGLLAGQSCFSRFHFRIHCDARDIFTEQILIRAIKVIKFLFKLFDRF